MFSQLMDFVPRHEFDAASSDIGETVDIAASRVGISFSASRSLS